MSKIVFMAIDLRKNTLLSIIPTQPTFCPQIGRSTTANTSQITQAAHDSEFSAEFMIPSCEKGIGKIPTLKRITQVGLKKQCVFGKREVGGIHHYGTNKPCIFFIFPNQNRIHFRSL